MPDPRIQRGKMSAKRLNAARFVLYTVATLPPASQAPGSPLYCSDAANTAAVAASLTTALAGANNDLKFTAKTAGTGGNAITVAYIDPSANDAVLAISVVGSAITVNLATSSEGAITSTAADILAAIEADEEASALVTVTNAGSDTGAGVVTALAAASLTGGTTEIIAGALVVSDGSNWYNLAVTHNIAGAGLGL